MTIAVDWDVKNQTNKHTNQIDLCVCLQEPVPHRALVQAHLKNCICDNFYFLMGWPIFKKNAHMIFTKLSVVNVHFIVFASCLLSH